jgi:hypothetical protein
MQRRTHFIRRRERKTLGIQVASLAFARQRVRSEKTQGQGCTSALRTADQNQAAINHALSNWATISSAAAANGIDPVLLAAIGVRESGFQNV